MPKGKRQKEDDGLLRELELFEKTRMPLSRSTSLWNEDQIENMKVLFQKYSKLEDTFQLAQDFKQWYDKSNANKSRIQIEKDLYSWYEKVENSKIKKNETCVKMLEKHEDNIINYFY